MLLMVHPAVYQYTLYARVCIEHLSWLPSLRRMYPVAERNGWELWTKNEQDKYSLG